ncbi:MAG: transposase [Xanthomonadaceae bacterium]|nr:transposase [Xanthomonadaceae bacterium]
MPRGLRRQSTKRVEGPFGWAKVLGSIQQAKQRGKARVNVLFQIVMMGWNLVRMRNILAMSPP